jgi:hypothetical protein
MVFRRGHGKKAGPQGGSGPMHRPGTDSARKAGQRRVRKMAKLNVNMRGATPSLPHMLRDAVLRYSVKNWWRRLIAFSGALPAPFYKQGRFSG